MKFECVNFNESAVAAMTKADFIAGHIGILWQDREEATRKKMLGRVYDLIVKPTKTKSK